MDAAAAPLLAEKAPLPLAPLPALKHVKLLRALNLVYALQYVAFMTHLDPAGLLSVAPWGFFGVALGTAYSQWTARRALRKREQLALEEGWTVEERADKDAEERNKLNVARRRCAWILAATNVLMAGLIGVMFYLSVMLKK